MEFSIRKARSSDVDAVTTCVERAYSHYIERIGKAPGPMEDNYVQVIAANETFVVESGASIVGLLVLIVTEEGLLLDNVAVDPVTQGTGLGGCLLALAEGEAIRTGYDSIYLYTHELMTENIPYYTKRGYAEYERKTVKGYKRIYMRKNLR